MKRPFIVEYRIANHGGPGVWSRWFRLGRYGTHHAAWQAMRLSRWQEWAFYRHDPIDREYRIEERPVKP